MRLISPYVYTTNIVTLLFALSCGDSEPTLDPERSGQITAPDQSANIEQTFAGKGSDGKSIIALTRHNTYFMVYLCDDERDAWFRVQAYSTPFEATNPEGAKLMLAMDETTVIGSISFPDQAPITFKLDPTDDQVLFRAQTRIGSEDAVGGWIRLPTGEERGVIRIGERRTTSRITVVKNERVSEMLRLTPAPFTPEALRAATPNARRSFDIYAMGDSYGAGEAAPERPGDYDDGGTLKSGGDREVWDKSLTSTAQIREARACHRSGISGIEVAGALLDADYKTGMDVKVTSFACSGAQTEHLIMCSYRGAIGDHYTRAQDFQPPQLNRVRQAAGPGGVDAIFMSIGGNNMRFGQLVSSCLKNECGPGSAIERDFLNAAQGMPPQYLSLARALEPVVPSPAAVYIAQYPNPLVNSAGKPCEEIDLFKFFGAAKVSKENVAWLANSVLPVLNSTTASGAQVNGWTLISQHLNKFKGHGYCTSDPWFADNPDSLKVQGNWMTLSLNAQDFPKDTCISPAETATSPGPVSPATVAGGVVHPNTKGYAQGYAPGIVEAMRARVEDHIRPAPVSQMRILAQELRGDVFIGWDDLSSTETQYRITVARDGQASPQNVVINQADQTGYVIDLPQGQAATGELRVKSCYISPTNRQVCAEERKLSWSNTPPTIAPQGLGLKTNERASASPCALSDPQCQVALVRLSWTPSAERGVAYYDVELTDIDDKIQRLSTLTPTFLASAQLKSARVRACNLLGCSDPSTSISGPECKSGEEVNFVTGQCVSVLQQGIPPRDVMCQGVTVDPGGVCNR